MIVLTAKEGREKSVLQVPAGEKAVVFEQTVAPDTQIVLEKGASLVHWRLQNRTDSILTASLAQESSYTLVTVKLGAGKTQIDASLNGEAAFWKSDIIYVAKNTDVARICTNVSHNADKTVSSQLIKGAAYDKAQASFEGGVLIPYGQKGVDGSQQHRALLLSDDAEVSAVPKLEIYSDDVKCAHGSAVGSLDESQLYYCMTRGLDERQAAALLTQGFLNEILYGVEDETVRKELGTALSAFAGFENDV